jgi:hypothetical protein
MLRSSLFLIYSTSLFIGFPFFSRIIKPIGNCELPGRQKLLVFCLKGLESHGIVRANIPPALGDNHLQAELTEWLVDRRERE